MQLHQSIWKKTSDNKLGYAWEFYCQRLSKIAGPYFYLISQPWRLRNEYFYLSIVPNLFLRLILKIVLFKKLISNLFKTLLLEEHFMLQQLIYFKLI